MGFLFFILMGVVTGFTAMLLPSAHAQLGSNPASDRCFAQTQTYDKACSRRKDVTLNMAASTISAFSYADCPDAGDAMVSKEIMRQTGMSSLLACNVSGTTTDGTSFSEFTLSNGNIFRVDVPPSLLATTKITTKDGFIVCKKQGVINDTAFPPVPQKTCVKTLNGQTEVIIPRMKDEQMNDLMFGKVKLRDLVTEAPEGLQGLPLRGTIKSVPPPPPIIDVPLRGSVK